MEEPQKPKQSSSALPSAQALHRLAISESGFVFDPMSGHHFTVNETGLEILKLLQKEQDLDMLLAKKRAADRKAWLQERGDLAEVS